MKSNTCPLLWISAMIILPLARLAAQDALPLHPGVYDSWQSIDKPGISFTGKLVYFEQNPQYGDGKLIIYQPSAGTYDTLPRVYAAQVSPDENYLAGRIRPFLRETRKARLDGKKKDELPKDSLLVHTLSGKKYVYPGLKSFGVPAKNGRAMFALINKPEPKEDSAVNDSLPADTLALKKKLSPKKKKDKTETYLLKIIYPSDSMIFTREQVIQAVISETGGSIVYSTFKPDSIPVSEVMLFDTEKQTDRQLFTAPGHIRNLSVDIQGGQVAFMHSSDTAKTKRYSLYYFQQSVVHVADTADTRLPAGFVPGEHCKVYFSEDGSKLYFGIAPAPLPEVKDTLTDDEKATVDIWHWRDPQLQPQQLNQLDEERKRSYLTVYHTRSGKLIPMADEMIRTVNTGFKGNGKFALGFNSEPYQVEASWRGNRYRDVYLINNETGERELLLQRIPGQVSLGNSGKYIAWYSESDSLWKTMTMKDKRITPHQAGKDIAFYDEEHDVPGLPGPAGSAGWLKDDKLFVIYDRFDLWGLDPEGKNSPVCLTAGEGRRLNIRFRNLNLDREVPHIENADGSLLLSSFDFETKDAGFRKLEGTGGRSPVSLLEGPYKYSTPVKAEKSQNLLWTRSTFSEFPDLWLSDMTFAAPGKISDANPRQKSYLWGSVEIVSWTTTAGKPQKGLLYKPAGFDPGTKYPALVYFYEKYTDQLHQYYAPKPSRSIISPTYCTSNGYVVFIPNIDYEDGYPGQSAYESVVSGTLDLIARGFIDRDRIGIQGQSWGGYQVAWLITRTNLYKAAMAGAPVSNMTSAYGGIRWESGMVRQFQYEEGQSRIGASLWDRPDLYIENSPLFRADKIETPLLIMANDADGAVPWYQGIELFTALRRLQKPCWLLNYNGDEHNLAKRGNMKDLDIRMMQFFDHYLKGKPAPEWMTKGLPAIDKGRKKGYNID